MLLPFHLEDLYNKGGLELSVVSDNALSHSLDHQQGGRERTRRNTPQRSVTDSQLYYCGSGRLRKPNLCRWKSEPHCEKSAIMPHPDAAAAAAAVHSPTSISSSPCDMPPVPTRRRQTEAKISSSDVPVVMVTSSSSSSSSTSLSLSPSRRVDRPPTYRRPPTSPTFAIDRPPKKVGAFSPRTMNRKMKPSFLMKKDLSSFEELRISNHSV